MTEQDFLELILSRVARIAVSASAVRGRGNTGVVAAGRQHLRSLNVEAFGTSDYARFEKTLNRETERLRLALPAIARHWGIARKVLNIFVRDCFYTTYLCEAFSMRKAEGFFEIPLDSYTAKGLQKEMGRGKLPRWPGVKGVTPDLNSKYQSAATQLAAERGVARIHLDALWWSQERD